MDLITQAKWDKAAKTFDLMAGDGPEKRWAPYKTELFSQMHGKVLFLAVGTGLDIERFPSGQDITGIDISPKMLEQAKGRVAAYDGTMNVMAMDVHHMSFPDNHFDQVFTSCTFCSVPNPVDGLTALKRVLKPGGELHMFEHTGSHFFPFNVMLNVITPLTRTFGPEVNRNTVKNVQAAGFNISKVQNIYLDVVKIISATAP